MKLDWRATLFLLGTVRAREISELEHLYREGTTPDTVKIDGVQVPTLSQALPQGREISRDDWTAVCTSATDGYNCDQAFDGNNNTYWESTSSETSQNITIDLGTQDYAVSGLTMVPRQDQAASFIEQHQVFLSVDNTTWNLVAYGTWWPDQSRKISAFQPQKAQYVRLSGPAPNGIAIADIKVYEGDFIPPNPSLGAWGPTIDFPLVPVSGAVDANSGEVVAWSAWGYNIFTGGKGGKTQTATWNGGNQSVTRRAITNTNHDMFCPGISMDEDAKFVVTGGADADQTSIYNTTVRDWFEGGYMNIPRGYQATSTLSDGRIFAIGGSFSGGAGGKNGEVWDRDTDEWTLLPNASVSAMLTNDRRVYRQDNHGWLFAWTNGSVFQAGPSKQMNWYGTAGNGSTTPAGDRIGDADAMCGNAIMFDQGQILTCGGSPFYEDTQATNNANIITINTDDQSASVLSNAGGGMNYIRTFHTSVVLPDGSVFVHGGQVVGLPFNESQAQMTPELFIPDSQNESGGRWVEQQRNSIVRVYHSIALLLQDGTVFTGGGGLCGDCEANHFDGEIYTPAYLLNSDGSLKDRPEIKTVTGDQSKPGGTVEITTDGPVDTQASIIRYGSTTHTVNTDQRRIGVQLTQTETNKYTFKIPAEPGVAQPGYYMLFVLRDGTPSHSVNVKVAGA
jgi:galactose oxidase